MKKNVFTILILSVLSICVYAESIGLSQLPDESIAFVDKYFPDYYLYRATEMNGTYALIFKGGLKIYVNSYGKWNTISGGGSEINIDYVEDKVKNAVKKEFPNEKIIYIQKKRKEYKIEFKSRRKISVDFEGNITKRGRD